MKLLRIWGVVLLVLSVIIYLSVPDIAPYGERTPIYFFSYMCVLLSITVFLIAYVLKKTTSKE